VGGGAFFGVGGVGVLHIKGLLERLVIVIVVIGLHCWLATSLLDKHSFYSCNNLLIILITHPHPLPTLSPSTGL
jgi:hypothetical protein